MQSDREIPLVQCVRAGLRTIPLSFVSPYSLASLYLSTRPTRTSSLLYTFHTGYLVAAGINAPKTEFPLTMPVVTTIILLPPRVWDAANRSAATSAYVTPPRKHTTVVGGRFDGGPVQSGIDIRVSVPGPVEATEGSSRRTKVLPRFPFDRLRLFDHRPR